MNLGFEGAAPSPEAVAGRRPGILRLSWADAIAPETFAEARARLAAPATFGTNGLATGTSRTTPGGRTSSAQR